MKDKDLFENGSFSPEWVSDIPMEAQEQPAVSPQFKDKETLLQELSEIKQRMQDIRAKEWQLAKMIEFNFNKLARE